MKKHPKQEERELLDSITRKSINLMAMFEKQQLFINTIKYLKIRQLYYQIYYKTKNIFFSCNKISYNAPLSDYLHWEDGIHGINTFKKNNEFSFLNINKIFDKNIDWNYAANGKLWVYNLNYFDFINQKRITKHQGLELIENFIGNVSNIKDGLEPYPISLRGINWIKFLSRHGIKSVSIDNVLFSHYKILLNNLEYHLLGNHLLENGFSLLFGAFYFKDDKFYQKGKKIVENELNEQVLNDGAHFELSPMYHQIILYRLLDTINLIQKNQWKEDELLEFLITKMKLMLGWIEVITFKSGDIPLFNDSAIAIAPQTDELIEYAKQLRLSWGKVILADSGYRKIYNRDYELVLDVGQIGPDYIPGHAHADTFNFELYVKGKPFIVDTGITTYEKNEKRQNERGTEAHNTVKIGNKDQSEVWGGFRVGRRAKVTILEEGTDYVNAIHNGYKHLGISHQRSFSGNDNQIVIVDRVQANTSGIEQKAFLHFHPNVDVCVEDNKLTTTYGTITFNDEAQVKMKCYSYNFSIGFNRTAEATKVCVKFLNDELITSVNFIN